jgi:hypothetical protein
MKPDNITEYFHCKCHSPDHTLRFDLVSFDDDKPEVYVSTHLTTFPLRRRIWAAIKYVFGYRCRYGHFDEFLLQDEDRTRLIQLLKMDPTGTGLASKIIERKVDPFELPGVDD